MSLPPVNPSSYEEITPKGLADRVLEEAVLRHSMAHALRAVESIAHDYHPHTDHKNLRSREYLRIKVHLVPKIAILNTEKDALMWLGSRSGSVPGPHPLAHIFIRAGLSWEDQRHFIAHELGHILLAFVRRKPGENFPQEFGNKDEDWCTEFADRVCMGLHYLYTKTEFQQASKFSKKADQNVGREEEQDQFEELFRRACKHWS